MRASLEMIDKGERLRDYERVSESNSDRETGGGRETKK